MGNPNKLSLVRSDAESYLLGDVGRLLLSGTRVIMLNGETADLLMTECMMRGISTDISLIEPGEKVYGDRLCYIIHTNNEYPDYDDDGYVWIRSI